MKLYRSTQGIFVEDDGCFFGTKTDDWDELVRTSNLCSKLRADYRGARVAKIDSASLLAPVVSQEVWAAGVTYFQSRSARIEESKDSGGASFYDRVYTAERPELFFKATGPRVIGPGGAVRIRSDARWSVPEPELTLMVNPAGEIVGYTIGNDMSSRDIEGDNPLYLPQAKIYDGSCAVGPCILLSSKPMPPHTAIKVEIERSGVAEFTGTTTLAELKRDPKDLVGFLFRDYSFPDGVLLMTGTGIVPDDGFSLDHGDIVRITIDDIGTLENAVA